MRKRASGRRRSNASGRTARAKREDPRQIPLFDDEATERLAEALARRMAPQGPSGPTFGECCDAWLRSVGARRLDTRNEQRHVEVLSVLGQLRASDLTPLRVREALAALLKPIGSLSAATVNGLRSKGKLVVQEAMLAGTWTLANPFSVVPRFKQAKPKHHRITLEEIRRVLPKLRRDRFREAMFSLILGPRAGEERALRKEDVDLDARTLIIRRSNGRDRTKTGEERTVPIPDELLPIIWEAMQASSSEMVFPDENGERQRANARMAEVLQRAYVAAGVVATWVAHCRRGGCGFKQEMKTREDGRCPRCGFKLWLQGQRPNVRWQDLRHAAATLHLEAGCHEAVVGEALGHAKKTTTRLHYLHLSLEFMRAELNKMRIFP